MRILITGGTGFLGKNLCQFLIGKGHELIVLTRATPPSPSEQLTFLQWDSKSIPPATGKVDAVINLAGKGIADFRWTEQHKKEVKQSRLDATRACVEFIRAQGNTVKVFLSSSAIGYYGAERGSEKLTEASLPGSDFLADVCTNWEKQAEGAGVRTVLLRTGVVFGKGEGPLKKLAAPFRFFVGGKLGNGKQGFSWIHEVDWIRATEFLLVNENSSGPVNLVGPQPVMEKEVASAIAKALRRPNLFPVPIFILKMLMGEMAGSLTGSNWVYPEQLIKYGFRFDFPEVNAAVKELLGSEK